MSYTEQIRRLHPCWLATNWLDQHGYLDYQQAWDACPNPDWMLWLIIKTCGGLKSPSHKRLMKLLMEMVTEISSSTLIYINKTQVSLLKRIVQVCDTWIDNNSDDTTEYASQAEADVLFDKMSYDKGELKTIVHAVVVAGWSHAASDLPWLTSVSSAHSHCHGTGATAALIRRHYLVPPSLTGEDQCVNTD